MTKKRHAKLLRALITNIHLSAIAQGGYPSGKQPKDLYKGVRLANDGHIPEGHTREQFWKSIKTVLECYGMADIKEINR